MFSSSNPGSGPATATRSRRRQRPANSDAIPQQPKAKRQRLPLTEQTIVNNDARPDNHAHAVKPSKTNKRSARPDGPENTPFLQKELSVRSKKPKAGERLSKGDGSILLTTNNAFTVSKLPALPDRLRTDWSSRQHGAIYTSSGYAMCLSHTHALVWPYTSTNPSPETFNFTLPYPSKHVSDPLPVGALVPSSASSDEPGLVVVMPLSGKVTYWESISSAATLDFLSKQRNGVEDTISGMYSSEHVTQIVNAESAGFVLAFSSGRLAHLSVRDTQGRPSISVQFLRCGGSGGSGGSNNSFSGGSFSSGLLGTLRNALSYPGSQGEIAAVRGDQTSRLGERDIVAFTTKGKLQAWRVHRGGHHDTLASLDARDDIARAVLEVDPASMGLSEDAMHVVDFTFIPKTVDQQFANMTRLGNLATREDDTVQHLLLLVSFSTKYSAQYSLVEAVLDGSTLEVGMVRPIKSYNLAVNHTSTEKPRIYLPKPGLMAFLVFDRAVVLASLALPPESPESQLQQDTQMYPSSFEDVIDLRNEDTVEIVGSGVEDPAGPHQEPDVSRSHRHRPKNPTAILLVRGFGIVRVSTTDVFRFASERPPRVTAKSKLEQAVFFGLKNDNPLVFDARRELQFSKEEIREAALGLSHDILSSNSPHLTNLTMSVGNNLRTRLTYTDRLVAHLQKLHVDLDSATRWELLANSEKLAAADEIWGLHEQFIGERTDGQRTDKKLSKKDIVSEIVEYIHEDEKDNPDSSIGEVDAVRHWFIHDVWRLEIFIAWAYQMIKTVHTDEVLGDREITRLIHEAAQISTDGLRSALRHRQKKLAAYGLADEQTGQDMLAQQYSGSKEPWTSSFYISNSVKRLTELCCLWLSEYYQPIPGADDNPESRPDPLLIQSIRNMLPGLTDHCLLADQEYARWATKSADPDASQHGKQCGKDYVKDCYSKVIRLREFGLWEEAIFLSKKHQAWNALAFLVVEHIFFLQEAAKVPELTAHEAAELRALASVREKDMSLYFEIYGDEFAFFAYDIILARDGIQTVFDFPGGDKTGYATRYFRSKPELAKISWMNDVEREEDIDHAAATLLNLGLEQESQVWSKKVELSLGKLALLAGSENAKPSLFHPRKSNPIKDTDIAKVDRTLQVIKIQDRLYHFIYPTIDNSIDASAELTLALESHAVRIPKKHKALAVVFEDALRRLLKREALDPLSLIDLLTLIYLPHSAHDKQIELHEDQFFMAFVVAENLLRGDEMRQAQRLVWRRCYLRDDWAQVNNTQFQDDDETARGLGKTATYQTMFACYKGRRANKDLYPVLKPSECLGVYTETLDARFDTMSEAERQNLLNDMHAEDAKLSQLIERCQLNEWARITDDTVMQVCRKQLDKQTDEGAADVKDEGAIKPNGSAPSNM